MRLTLRCGRFLIRLARKTVENSLKNGKLELENPKDGQLKRGMRAFVTIHTYPERSLRGCIGFTSPLPLYEVVQRAAYAAAFGDPRFPPLTKKEMEEIIFEISLLSEPEELACKPEDYAKKIEIGKDGLIVQFGSRGGLLLPQVPVEQNWTAEEFLEQVCFKAGLMPDCLQDKSTRLWKFQAQIFSEKQPGGEVEEVTL